MGPKDALSIPPKPPSPPVKLVQRKEIANVSAHSAKVSNEKYTPFLRSIKYPTHNANEAVKTIENKKGISI